jgi:hypothetical protein
MVDRDLQQPIMPAAVSPRRLISEVVREIMTDVPLEDFEGLPRDGASERSLIALAGSMVLPDCRYTRIGAIASHDSATLRYCSCFLRYSMSLRHYFYAPNQLGATLELPQA